MEPVAVGAFPDGEWDCFGKIFAPEEHENITCIPQFLGDEFGTLNTFCSAPELGENHYSNSHYVSQESSYSSNCSVDTLIIANQGHANYYFSYPDDHVLANNNNNNNSCVYSKDGGNFSSLVPSLGDIVMQESVKLNEDAGSDRLVNSYQNQMEAIAFPTKQFKLKRKLDVPAQDTFNNRSENHKKKPPIQQDAHACMKNTRSKKKEKGEEVEESNGRSEGQSCTSNMSEDDNVSEENSGGASSASKSSLNSNGKPRATRGSATDPQSLYARKRRERINERLRMLQNLVPNGTKVDISTMLEEAVNYVKFLQLQIKLLSSDDLWMYAPLAYNGLDIGVNLKM